MSRVSQARNLGKYFLLIDNMFAWINRWRKIYVMPNGWWR